MNKSTLGTTLILTTLAAVLGSFIFSQSAVSHDSDKSYFSKSKYRGVTAVNNNQYQEACGDCHMAYSPGLLPSKNWQKVMVNLDDHFGDNAELPAIEHQQILNYLVNNSAEKSAYRRSIKIARSLFESNQSRSKASGSTANEKVVDRISLTPYFIRKHDEIPKRFVIDNPKVGSFSQCNLCHLNAEKGSFNEDEVSIPSIGYWHD